MLNNEGLHNPSAFSPETIDSSQHSASRFRPLYGPHLQHSPVMPLSTSTGHHFGSPVSPSRLTPGCIDQPLPDRPGTTQCVDTSMLSCYPPSSTLMSPKGQVCEMYPSPPKVSKNLENNVIGLEQYMPLGCYQSPQYTRDGHSEKRRSGGLPSANFSSSVERSLTDMEKASSLPKGFEAKVHPELKLLSNSGMSKVEQQGAQINKSNEGALNDQEVTRTARKVNNEWSDGSIKHQSAHHQPVQHQSVNIDHNDLARFFNHLDACFSVPARVTQPIQGIQDPVKNFSSTNSSEPFQSMEIALNAKQSNPIVQRDGILAHIQKKFPKVYSHSHPQDSRVLQEMYEQYLSKQISGKHRLMQLNSSHEGPPSFMTRSLSSDNFRVESGQFSMSPPNAPPNKLKRRRRKARSKDDTSKPSPEATKKLSSLMLSCKTGNVQDRIVSEISKETEKRTKEFSDKVGREIQGRNENDPEVSCSASNDVMEGRSEEKNVNTVGCEKQEPLKRQDVLVNQDVTARVALAFAGFNHDCNLDANNQYNAPFVAEQKIPTGAKWIENVKNELSSDEIPSNKATSNSNGSKKGFGDAHFECFNTPPSPEFLPKIGKDAESLELLKPGLPEIITFDFRKEDSYLMGNETEQGGKLEQRNKAEQTSRVDQSRRDVSDEAKLTESIDSSEMKQLKLKQITDGSLVNENLPNGSRQKQVINDGEKQLARVKHQELNSNEMNVLVSNTVHNQGGDTINETSLSQVPIASVPVALLGAHLGKGSDLAKKQDKNTATVVRNIYGRTLYQKGQRGPNFAQQLRTDKIIEVASSSEIRSELKPLPEVTQKNEFSVSNKIQTSDSSAHTSCLKEMLQATKSPIGISFGTHLSSSAQQSTKIEALPSLLKHEQSTKVMPEKSVKVKEKGDKTSICKHKRKPCKCDLEKAVASLANSAPLSCTLSTTFQSLQRLANPSNSKPRKKNLMKLAASHQNTAAQSDLQSNEGVSLATEPSFSILESKDVIEEANSQQIQAPTSSHQGEGSRL